VFIDRIVEKPVTKTIEVEKIVERPIEVIRKEI